MYKHIVHGFIQGFKCLVYVFAQCCKQLVLHLVQGFKRPMHAIVKRAAGRLCIVKQIRSTERSSKFKRSVDMTSSGTNGLNIRTNVSSKWDMTRCPEE